MPYIRTVIHTRPNTSIDWFKQTSSANVYASNGFVEFGSNTSSDELTKVLHTTWDTQINGLTFVASLTSPTPAIQQTLEFLINNPGYTILMTETISNT
jgi:hypothetical protein